MSPPISSDGSAERHAIAWDTQNGTSDPNEPLYQPWREFWPPRNVGDLSEAEIRAKPWLTWKRDKTKPNDKPWYFWVNVFEGDVDEPCKGEYCKKCNGEGCVSLAVVPGILPLRIHWANVAAIEHRFHSGGGRLGRPSVIRVFVWVGSCGFAAREKDD